MQDLDQLEAEVEGLTSKLSQLKSEIQKVIVGQDKVIDQLIVGLLAKGHVLLEGLPGLAKTLLVKTLAQVLDLSFNRIQFTPDLMPTDILGTEVIEEDDHHKKSFVYRKGPVFTNVLLADEINRTPPKTQAALLEVMQEYKVTYAGKDFDLDPPFFLLATQNPIEQSGTFPLPEAQVDRFLLYVVIGYPTEAEEEEVLVRTTSPVRVELSAILSGSEIIRLQELTREVNIAEQLVKVINRIVRDTRPENSQSKEVKEYIAYGAGPRAGQSIILAAKAFALLNRRYSVVPDDIKEIIHPALRHRMVLNFKAESQQVNPDAIIDALLNQHPIK